MPKSKEVIESATETHVFEVIDGGGDKASQPCGHGDGKKIGQGFGKDNQLTYYALRCPQTGATWIEAP